MREIAWYLSDYADEVLPCDATLEGWAEWLSRPDPTWPHDVPGDGATFEAARIRFEDDIIVQRRSGGEWTFSRPIPEDASLLAVRYGPGLGWQPDNIVWGESMETALREWLAENDEHCDDEEYVAVGFDEPKQTLIYKSSPPRLIPSSGAMALSAIEAEDRHG